MVHRTYKYWNDIHWDDMVPGDTFAFDNEEYKVGVLLNWSVDNEEQYVCVKAKEIALVVSRREYPSSLSNYFMFLLPGPILTPEILM